MYDSAPVHAKVYVWLKGDEPVAAFAGSANFTQSAFGEKRRESVQTIPFSPALNTS